MLFALVAAFMIGSAVQQYRDSLELERVRQIRAVMQWAIAVLTDLANAEQSGRVSREEAQARGRAALAQVRFNEADYMIAIDGDGVYQVHPNPAWAHVAHNDLPELPHTMTERTLHDLKTSPEAVYRVTIARVTGGAERSKINYAVMFEPWHWAIGTGIYIDDIDTAVWQYAMHLGVVSLAATAFTCLVSCLVLLEFDKGLSGVLDAMAQMQAGQLDRSVPGERRRDEAGRVSRALDRFRISLREADQLRAGHVATMAAAAVEQRRIMAQTADAFEERSASSPPPCATRQRIWKPRRAACRLRPAPQSTMRGKPVWSPMRRTRTSIRQPKASSRCRTPSKTSPCGWRTRRPPRRTRCCRSSVPAASCATWRRPRDGSRRSWH